MVVLMPCRGIVMRSRFALATVRRAACDISTLRWVGPPRFRPDIIDDGLRLLEGDHAVVPGVNVAILPGIDARALVVSAHFRRAAGTASLTPRENGIRSPAALPL